jgi:AraC family transcriptional regulator, regulatory protein of adaptative response / DNA-3-methyladenine glycosylase II
MNTLASTPLAPLKSNDDAYYQAMLGRDARFDGVFFTGVTSTGIYCRPVCKVRAPKRENCRFFGHAAQAEGAGFRPCMRCRPELAPHALMWSIQDASHTLALQATRLLDEAPLDAAPSVADLAAKLGVSDRHVRRIFEAHIGVSPLQYLQTRRLLTAKQLLTDTQMGIGEVALASGWGSLRRFNAAFAEHYRMPPTALRKATGVATDNAVHADQSARSLPKDSQKLNQASSSVLLGYRPPYDIAAMLSFAQTRQLDTMEYVVNNDHMTMTLRSFSIKIGQNVHQGWVRSSFEPARNALRLEVSASLRPALPAIIRRTRAAFDLDANPAAIDAVLGAHFPHQAGLRVPGALDGFEVAIRAIVGQQVTVAAGRRFVQRMVDAFGAPISTPYPQISKLFPTAEKLAKTPPEQLGALGIVRQRQDAIIALSRAVAAGEIDLNASSNALATIEQLKALPGIGDWTAQYIAMRALRWPDAFPAGDVALHNALGVRGEKQPARAAEAASQAWRPWRSYAVLRAWATLPAHSSAAVKSGLLAEGEVGLAEIGLADAEDAKVSQKTQKNTEK